MLSTLIVTNGQDSGPGSLRDTIAAAADGDTILTCGLSGESSPELAALYQEAFSRQ